MPTTHQKPQKDANHTNTTKGTRSTKVVKLAPLAMAVGVCGLARCRINVSQARISLYSSYLRLGSADSDSRDLVTALLNPARSASTAVASSSALTSLLESHGDHVGSATFWSSGILSIVIVILVFLLLVKGHRCCLQVSACSSSVVEWILAMEIISLRFSLRALCSHVSLCRSTSPILLWMLA
jgi:hypothetical protein